jgi:hypothetical protein
VDNIFYADNTWTLSRASYWMYNVNDATAQVGYDVQTIGDGDIVKWGDESCADTDENWNFSWITTIEPVTVPDIATENSEDATIAAENILYWIGKGANQAIFVANWCEPEKAFAWGYRFNTETVLVSSMMDSIAVTDSRFSYTANGGYIDNLFYNDNVLSLSGNDYWGFNVNGATAQFLYNVQSVSHGDIVKMGEVSCAHTDEDWNNTWTTTIVPVTVPEEEIELFDGPVGTEGCRGIHCDNPNIIAWATGCKVTRGYQNIALQGLKASYGSPEDAIGKVTESTTAVVSLGDGGEAILTFDFPIINGAGYDFAVFDNSLNGEFLELAFVEVSSDSIYWTRFPAISNTQTDIQTDGFGTTNPRHIHNLAGKYLVGWGTPFDLEDLAGDPQLDLNNIRYVKVIDVVGSINPLYASYDSRNRIINDPYPTNFASGGFDLSGVAVINGDRKSSISVMEQLQHSVHPNPCVDYVWVTTQETETVLSLYSAQGTLLWQGMASSETTKIEMQNYPSGLYILSAGNFKAKIVKR